MDFFDGNLGVGLSVALAPSVVFLGFIFEYHDLLALAVFHDLAGNGRAFHFGSADGDCAVFFHDQDVVKLNGVAVVGLQFFNINGIAFGDLLLFPSSYDNCVH